MNILRGNIILNMAWATRPIRTFLSLAIIFSASAISAQRSTSPSNAELAAISARGRLLAEYDLAAWYSSDAVRALNPTQGSVTRYIARKTDAGWVVAYGRLNDSRGAFLVVYEATPGASPQECTVEKYDPPRQDTGFYFSAAKAIETALRDFQGDNRPYNAAALPADSNQMHVYVVPARTVTGVYPLGGDVRYLISVDGSTIIEKRQLHKTILEFRDSGKLAKTVSGYHTHVLSDVPEDTDVFYVLTRKPLIPEFVGTKNLIYIIQIDGSIVREKY
jgi:hypothetical protein